MTSWPRIPHLWWFVASTVVVALSNHADFRKMFLGGDAPRQLGEIDVARIGELHRITDTLGGQIWPGFDTRKIPVAINNDDRQELLVGHPHPPTEFHPFERYQTNEAAGADLRVGAASIGRFVFRRRPSGPACGPSSGFVDAVQAHWETPRAMLRLWLS